MCQCNRNIEWENISRGKIELIGNQLGEKELWITLVNTNSANQAIYEEVIQHLIDKKLITGGTIKVTTSF